jgi:hypothetical protein
VSLFKVGDQVRIDGDTAELNIPVSEFGKIGTIIEHDDGCTWGVDVGHEWPWIVHEQDLSLVVAGEI